MAASKDHLACLATKQRLMLRAFGSNCNLKHFAVWAVQPLEFTKAEGGNMLFSIVVNEANQYAEMRTQSKEAVLVSQGGLAEKKDVMTLTNPCTNTRIAKIDRSALLEDGEIDCTSQLRWHAPLDFLAGEETKLNVYFGGIHDIPPFSLSSQACLMNPVTTSSAIGIHIRLNTLNTVKKAILIFGALKMYYTICKFQCHSIPSGIPGMGPKGCPQDPSLNSLQHLNRLRFRFACWNLEDYIFGEYFDESTGHVELIVRYPKGRPKKAKFGDAYGMVQFYIGESKGAGLVEVLSYDKTCIGYWTADRTTQCFYVVKNNPVMVERELRPRSDQVSQHKVTVVDLMSPHTQNVAEFFHHRADNTISVTLSPSLNVEYKAMVLARAIHVGGFSYEMEKQTCLPSLESYPYRPILSD